MPTTYYKEARTCVCGYTTIRMSCWSTHQRSCKLITLKRLEETRNCLEADAKRTVESELLAGRERIAFLEQQLEQLHSELREKNSELAAANKQLSKRKPPKRIHRTEPQRRQIAKRQNWICAGKDCTDAKQGIELQEYDIDHVIPLSCGGTDDTDNLQALCPRCHRRKTDQERLSNNVSCAVEGER